MTNRVYAYIGAADLNDPELFQTERTQIVSDVQTLMLLQKGQRQKRLGPSVYTFVVDTYGQLWVADRQSKHVSCARGGDVLSAGGMTFDVEDGRAVVTGVTNHSTGYCPEPDSWPSVQAALDRANLPHPGRFTQELVFRLCENCGQRNVVKENDYTCAVCGNELPQEWNFRRSTGDTE